MVNFPLRNLDPPTLHAQRKRRMGVDVPKPRLFPSGGTAIKYSPGGGSFAYYMSGRMACAYERFGSGFYAYFYADNKRGDTLVAFGPDGCGYVTFRQGGPRLTSQKTGGTFNSDASGGPDSKIPGLRRVTGRSTS